MIIQQLCFSGVNKLPVHEETNLLIYNRWLLYWVSVTQKQIAQWYFTIVQISIDIRVIIAQVHVVKWLNIWKSLLVKMKELNYNNADVL